MYGNWVDTCTVCVSEVRDQTGKGKWRFEIYMDGILYVYVCVYVWYKTDKVLLADNTKYSNYHLQ